MEQRNLNFDFLKTLAAFAVVWVHTAGGVVMSTPDTASMAWWAGNLADAMGRWSVPLFVMMSGALLLASPATADTASFYRKRARRLLPPLLFWSLFYLAAQLAWCPENTPAYTLADATRALLSGVPYYHLWYLYMVVGIDLAAPLLRRLLAGSRPGAIAGWTAAAFAAASVESLARAAHDVGHSFFLSRFPPYIPYFVAGHYFFNVSKWRPTRFLLPVAALCGLLIAVGTAALTPFLGPLAWEVAYSNLDPLVVVMSICVFLHFIRTPMRPHWIQNLAPLSLGIYLIHPLWLWVFARLGLSGSLLHPFVGIPLTAALAFALSGVSTSLLLKLPYLRRTVC